MHQHNRLSASNTDSLSGVKDEGGDDGGNLPDVGLKQ